MSNRVGKTRRYSEAEDRIIVENLLRIGPEQTAALLVGRSASAVAQRGLMLGLRRRTVRRHAWTAGNDADLRKLFEEHGSDCVGMVRGRSRKAVHFRLRVLGLIVAKRVFTNGNRHSLTESQARTLTEVYASLGPKATAKLIGKSVSQTRSHAHLLGVAKPLPRWSPAKDDKLRANYAIAAREKLMEMFPEHSMDSIYGRAQLLGLRRH